MIKPKKKIVLYWAASREWGLCGLFSFERAKHTHGIT